MATVKEMGRGGRPGVVAMGIGCHGDGCYGDYYGMRLLWGGCYGVGCHGDRCYGDGCYGAGMGLLLGCGCYVITMGCGCYGDVVAMGLVAMGAVSRGVTMGCGCYGVVAIWVLWGCG